MIEVIKKKKKGRLFRDDTLSVYAMIWPLVVGFFVFTIYPIFWVLRYSFFEYNGISHAKFTGLYNFIRVFERSPDFWYSVSNSLLITLALLTIETTIALALAVFLNSKSKINSYFRTIFFMPSIISSAIIGVIFSIMFASYKGIINNMLINSGIINLPVDWFANKWTALLVIFISMVWSGFGITMVYFLMGLQSVPEELYECAEMDGAKPYQKFFKITLPMLAPVLQIILMLKITGGMKVTDLALVLTNGMPGGRTEMVMTYVYKYFFSQDAVTSGAEAQFGYASAMSVVIAIIIGIMTLIYLRLSRRMKKIY